MIMSDDRSLLPVAGWLVAIMLGFGVTGAAAARTAGPDTAPTASLSHDAGWQWRQADLEVARLTGRLPSDRNFQQNGIGGVASGTRTGGEHQAPVLPMLMSLVLPGAGEVYLGHKRGFLMMALDAASWYGMAHNADQGRTKRDEYYAFADEHWFLGKLDASYDPAYLERSDANFDYSQVVGIGTDYFGVTGYTNLPLWVSAADDRREYYENLGKWNQFVFGWDDFVDPRVFLGTSDIDIANLQDPRVSANREAYRQLRQESNDAFARRDRFVYLSLGLRVFSVLQVAYLEGLLFGNGDRQDSGANHLEISGHRVDIFVEPVGFSRGVIGAAVSF
jgi:hypothetical protein